MRVGRGLVARSSLLIIFAALLSSLGLFLIAGCSSNSPEGAVSKYLDAQQSGNWSALKASVVPQNLTKEQEALAKEKFQQVKVKLEGIKTQATYNQGDKNKATVVLTDGRVTYTANILGETKTETEDIKKLEKEQRTYDVVRIKGVWYVDTKI
jgi:glucan-binding YG repeat protein